jgi:hypothetical protein
MVACHPSYCIVNLDRGKESNPIIRAKQHCKGLSPVGPNTHGQRKLGSPPAVPAGRDAALLKKVRANPRNCARRAKLAFSEWQRPGPPDIAPEKSMAAGRIGAQQCRMPRAAAAVRSY